MTLEQARKAYDPDELTCALARRLAGQAPVGFIIGRGVLRDAVAQLLHCSQGEAEDAVEQLIARGRLVFVKPPEQFGAWAFRLSGSC